MAGRRVVSQDNNPEEVEVRYDPTEDIPPPSSPTLPPSSPSYTPRVENAGQRAVFDIDSLSMAPPPRPAAQRRESANPMYSSHRHVRNRGKSRYRDDDDNDGEMDIKTNLQALRDDISSRLDGLKQLDKRISPRPDMSLWRQYQAAHLCRGERRDTCLVFCFNCFGQWCKACADRYCDAHSNFLVDSKTRKQPEHELVVRRPAEIARSCLNMKNMLIFLERRYATAQRGRSRGRSCPRGVSPPRARKNKNNNNNFARSRSRRRSRTPPPRRSRSPLSSSTWKRPRRASPVPTPRQMTTNFIEQMKDGFDWTYFKTWKGENEDRLEKALLSQKLTYIRNPLGLEGYDVHVLMLLKTSKRAAEAIKPKEARGD